MVSARSDLESPPLAWRLVARLWPLAERPAAMVDQLLEWAAREERIAQLLGRVSGVAEPDPATLRRALERLGGSRLQHRLWLGGARAYVAGPLVHYNHLDADTLCRRAVRVGLWAEVLSEGPPRRALKPAMAGIFAVLGMRALDVRGEPEPERACQEPCPDLDALAARWGWEARFFGQTSLEAGATLAVAWGFTRAVAEVLAAVRDPGSAPFWKQPALRVRLAHHAAAAPLERGADVCASMLLQDPEGAGLAGELGLSREMLEDAAQDVWRAWRHLAARRPGADEGVAPLP